MTIPTVDLSYNKFSGGISLLLSSVENLYLNNNRFTGEVPTSIQTMYLQHNFLTGIQISPVAEIPVSSPLCLQYNCMVPPLQTPCPLKACPQKTRLLHNATNGEGNVVFLVEDFTVTIFITWFFFFFYQTTCISKRKGLHSKGGTSAHKRADFATLSASMFCK